MDKPCCLVVFTVSSKALPEIVWWHPSQVAAPKLFGLLRAYYNPHRLREIVALEHNAGFYAVEEPPNQAQFTCEISADQIYLLLVLPGHTPAQAYAIFLEKGTNVLQASAKMVFARYQQLAAA